MKPSCRCRRCKGRQVQSRGEKVPWRRAWKPTPEQPLWALTEREVMLSHELSLNLTSIYKILTDSHLQASEYTYCNTFLRAGFCFKTNRYWGGKYFQNYFSSRWVARTIEKQMRELAFWTEICQRKTCFSTSLGAHSLPSQSQGRISYRSADTAIRSPCFFFLL